MMPDMVTEQDKQTPEEIEEETKDLEKLLSCKCAFCGKRIYLVYCDYTENYAPICKGGCR